MQRIASQSSPIQDEKVLGMRVAEGRRPGRRGPEWLGSPDLRRGRRRRADPRSIAPSNEVMEVVQTALATAEPEKAIADRLSTLQAIQRARFENLPERLKHSDWVLLRHGRMLQRNQAIHDAASDVLRLVRSWTQAA